MNLDGLDYKNLQNEFLCLLSEEGKSPNTIKNYQTDLDLFFHYVSEKGPKNFHFFNISEILDYNGFLSRRYNSENSRRRKVQTLRLFFDYLVKKKLYLNNPVRKIRPSPKFLDRPRPTSYKDLHKLWYYLDGSLSLSISPFQELLLRRNQLLLAIIYGCGAQVSNISRMLKKDVLLQNSPRLLIRPRKRDPHSVPLPFYVVDIIAPYFDLLQRIQKEQGLNFTDLFFNANPHKIFSGGLGPRGMELIFKEYSEILSITITPKSIRQSSIIKWIQQGVPDSLIKEWIGVSPSYSLKLYHDYLPKFLPFIESF